MPEITGILKVKFDIQKVSDKFQKRDIVVTIDETTQYPQDILFQLNQSRCEDVNNIIVGEKVKVSYNLKGREWNGPQGVKFFNTLEAWQICKV